MSRRGGRVPKWPWESAVNRWLLAGSAALGVMGLAAPAAAAVAILHAGAARELILVDAERLDAGLLSRLARAGFAAEETSTSDCEVVDAGILGSRIQQAGRVVAMLSDANHQQVLASLQLIGAQVELDRRVPAVGASASVELQSLQAALGPEAAGLYALVARVGD
jgi:hypothetical protein